MKAAKVRKLLLWGLWGVVFGTGSFSHSAPLDKDSSGVPIEEKCASYLDPEESAIFDELLASLDGSEAVTPAGVMERLYVLKYSHNVEAIEAAALDLIKLETQQIVEASDFAEDLARKLDLIYLGDAHQEITPESFHVLIAWFSNRLPIEAFEVLAKIYIKALGNPRLTEIREALSFAGYLELVLYPLMATHNAEFLSSKTQMRQVRPLYFYLKEIWGVKEEDSSRHYRLAHSRFGQYFGFLSTRREKIRQVFNREIFVLDPFELSVEDFGPMIAGVIQFMRLEPSVDVDLSSSEATPLAMFADFLSQISHAEAIGLRANEKKAILEAFEKGEAQPLSGKGAFRDFGLENQYFLDLAFFWEEFLAEVLSQQENIIMPKASTLLPFLKRVDPSVREFLLKITAQESVYKLIEESLLP